jgi:hypothetical protein
VGSGEERPSAADGAGRFLGGIVREASDRVGDRVAEHL